MHICQHIYRNPIPSRPFNPKRKWRFKLERQTKEKEQNSSKTTKDVSCQDHRCQSWWRKYVSRTFGDWTPTGWGRCWTLSQPLPVSWSPMSAELKQTARDRRQMLWTFRAITLLSALYSSFRSATFSCCRWVFLTLKNDQQLRTLLICYILVVLSVSFF